MPAKFPKRDYAPRPRRRDAPPPGPAARTAWEQPSAWYDALLGDAGDDFYRRIILPATLRRLDPRPGQRVLDVACGQGVLGRVLAEHGVSSLGVDASPALIAAANRRAGPLERYLVGDARDLPRLLPGERFDHAALVMCLQDLDPVGPVLAGVRQALKPGGRVVMVMTHPCFRVPRRSSWGWDDAMGVQFRRLEGYLTFQRVGMKIHPGQPQDTTATTSFHRPLNTYLDALGSAGLGVVGCEELCSHRRGSRGSRSGAEDLAAKEIPLFLVLVAVPVPG